MITKNLALSATVLLSLSALSACGDDGSSTSGDADTYSVGLVLGSGNSPFYSTVQTGAEAKAEELGVELVVQSASKWDPVAQTAIIDGLIAKKVDAMVVVPTDATALIAPLQRAYDAGITVVTIDTAIGDGDYEGGEVTFPVSEVTSDNVAGGRTACEALIEQIGGAGDIYVEDVQPGATSSDERFAGCEEAVDATDGAVTIAGHSYSNEDSSKAAANVAAALQANPDLKGIFGTDGYASDGAVNALRQANVTDQVALAFFDGRRSGADAIADGTVDILVAQQTTEIGSQGVQDAVDALNGETVEKLTKLSVAVITKENVDDPEMQALIYG
jgi:ribose transport system substrate-binding protein